MNANQVKAPSAVGRRPTPRALPESFSDYLRYSLPAHVWRRVAWPRLCVAMVNQNRWRGVHAAAKQVVSPCPRKSRGHGTRREGRRVRHRFWQPGGGYDRNITTTATLRYMIEYLHANPVRRGLVAEAEDFEWSSARWFAGMRPAQLLMDEQVRQELQRDAGLREQS